MLWNRLTLHEWIHHNSFWCVYVWMRARMQNTITTKTKWISHLHFIRNWRERIAKPIRIRTTTLKIWSKAASINNLIYFDIHAQFQLYRVVDDLVFPVLYIFIVLHFAFHLLCLSKCLMWPDLSFPNMRVYVNFAVCVKKYEKKSRR